MRASAGDLASVIEARVDGHWLDAMGLQKLLYYTQAWHLAIKGRPLFEGQFEAWPEGPVLPEVLHARQHKVSRQEMHKEAARIELDGEIWDRRIQAVVAFDLGGLVGQDARRACDADPDRTRRDLPRTRGRPAV